MELSAAIKYRDGWCKAFGFFTNRQFCIQYMRSMAQLGKTKGQLREIYTKQSNFLSATIIWNLLIIYGWLSTVIIAFHGLIVFGVPLPELLVQSTFFVMYLPVMGMLGGVFKVWLSFYEDSEPSIITFKNTWEIRIALLARGTFEILLLGIIFLPIDLYVTYKRYQYPLTAGEVIDMAGNTNTVSFSDLKKD
jgi:hypothetical protein